MITTSPGPVWAHPVELADVPKYLSIPSQFSVFFVFRCKVVDDLSHSSHNMYLEPKGRNWGDIVNWDDLGKLYAAIICIWTLVLVLGISWLIANRKLPFIKIRNIPLAILSTVFLHTYLIKICLAYTTNGHFLCSAEYWIMSIYLPFGIALFQAYLTQLRSLWEQQQRLLHHDAGRPEGEDISKVNFIQRWRRLSRLKRSYCLIAAGMLLQVRQCDDALSSLFFALTLSSSS